MKRFVALFLFLCCITLLFSSCKQPPIDSPDKNTSGQSTTSSTESTIPTDKAKETDGAIAQYAQTAISEALQGKQQTVSLQIPKLLPFSEDAITAQTEIQSILDPMVAKVRDDLAGGYSTFIDSISYAAYINDSVFSLVIHVLTTVDQSSYYVYNFDIDTGKRLDTEGLMHKLQITDYAEKFTQIAQTAFESKWGTTGGAQKDLYTIQKNKTIGTENIGKAMPYMAENGKVIVILNIYSLAGAEYYTEVFPLS